MILLRLFLTLLLCVATPVAAQLIPRTDPVDATLSRAADELRQVDATFDETSRVEDHPALRDRAIAVRATADAAVTQLTPDMALVDARIAELGPKPATPEPRDIAVQRAALADAHNRFDSAIKRARLLSVEAAQLADEISGARAEQFGERVSTRGASPLSPALWHDIWRDLPRDGRRVTRFGATVARDIVRAAFGDKGWMMAIGLAIAVLLAWPARLWLRHAGRRFAIESAPGSRARRTGLALWFLVVGTITIGLAAVAVVQGIAWAGGLGAQATRLTTALVPAIFVAAFIVALSGSLLLRRQPSWRLLPIDDADVDALRPFGWGAGSLAFVDTLLTAGNRVLGVSQAARVAVEGATALAYAFLIVGMLVTIGRLRAAQQAQIEGAEDQDAFSEPPRHALLAIVLVAAWIVVGTAVVAALIGYLPLALFLVREAVWVAVVSGATTLLLAGIDDIATTLIASQSRFGRAAHVGVGVRGQTIDQIGVLASALLRVALVLMALGAVLVPFGSDIGSILDGLQTASAGVTIGQVTIAPGAILRAVIVLLVALALVRAIGRWLETRYLPATALDAGARNSVATVARYVGIILATLWAMASLGIGMERIGLVLSALSVGIGFGLQAITQNFVSGLILLAERPVKIGDLVRVGDQDGDVKKISVRATEIQIADGSTLIVPNSELITKSVRNMTLADPLGRVQIQFAVPASSDVAAIRDMLLDIYAAHPGVLETPAPVVMIDALVGGQVQFLSFAHVSGPRAVGGVRSDLLFTLLDRFRDAGIHLQPPAQEIRLVRDDPAP